jgi:hypothetical protein
MLRRCYTRDLRPETIEGKRRAKTTRTFQMFVSMLNPFGKVENARPRRARIIDDGH